MRSGESVTEAGASERGEFSSSPNTLTEEVSMALVLEVVDIVEVVPTCHA